ncbi:ABC transporter ATP-binding protein [Candidatus Competibacter phosphatis]|uniref:ABC transporter ATP-binding protein n=1 Tax=Candidatus Competibacter phosphatis TaxID=221280 RepID=UPI00145CF4B7|nr:ABC transporter ATP-binding protein [Candidatus Competibacter phosphatis]
MPSDALLSPAVSSSSKQKELLLEVAGLSSDYGPVHAIHQADLQVHTGELAAIVGGNGAGKTTLLHTLSGLHPSSGGRIRFAGLDITRWPTHRIVAAGICQVPEGRQVFAPLSVEDNLRLGAYRIRDHGWVQRELEHVYTLFPILAERRRQLAGTLSGGQQQMLAIGRALLGRPRLLLLDEPSMGLAPLLVEEIFRVIVELNSQGVTILLVEQNARAALTIANRGYILETGRIVKTAPAAELLADDAVRRAYLGY